MWPFDKKIIKQEETLQELYPEGVMSIKFHFVKKGVDYNLEIDYNCTDQFLDTLKDYYGINEPDQRTAIERFLALGFLRGESIDLANVNGVTQ